MNFDFSEEALAIGEEAKRVLSRHDSVAGARHVLDGKSLYDEALWRLVVKLGWPAAAIPEEYGGSGLAPEVLCMLAYELGRGNAAIPFSSSVYFATSAILAYGTPEQKQRLLPALAEGKKIGTFCFDEGFDAAVTSPPSAEVVADCLSGTKWPVADGTYANFAVVAARADNSADQECGLFIVDLDVDEVVRESLVTLDPTRDYARIHFSLAHAERLGSASLTRDDLHALLARACVPLSFEQLGGAQASLDMAVDYAKLRYAFGRPIGSFQAIKHKLADMYIAVELARSNAYFAAWALASSPSALPLAAATAHVCASNAFHLCSKENIQVHGGFGVTWEADCHLYLRRSKALAALVGGSAYWKEKIVSELIRQPDLIAG